MKLSRYISILFIVALLSAVACSKSATTEPKPLRDKYPHITAYLDKDSIKIGDRVIYTIEVERDVMQHILFPTFDLAREREEGVEVSSVEVVRDFDPDTIKGDGRHDLLRKRYELAIFDEGIYHLGRGQALYVDKNIVDTLFTEDESTVVVTTFQIDSTAVLRPLKPQMWPKFYFGEISGYLAIAIAVVALLALLIWLLAKHLHKRGKRLRDIFKTPPPPPAHIVAIEALERLKNQKLWQNSKHKQYYSALSEILRTYIADAFSVGAMEMTTDEIIEALHDDRISQKSKMDLVSVLRDADLVKFAKAIPEAEDNELAFDKAYYFVEETKPVEVYDKEQEDTPTKNEKR